MQKIVSRIRKVPLGAFETAKSFAAEDAGNPHSDS